MAEPDETEPMTVPEVREGVAQLARIAETEEARRLLGVVHAMLLRTRTCPECNPPLCFLK